MSATGKCLCGKVTYRLASKPLMLHVCHYKNCQRQAGASFIPFVAVPLTEVEVEGTSKVFMDDDTAIGNTVARHLCRDCGSPIYVVVARAPKTAYFASGTLDHTDHLVPKCHG